MIGADISKRYSGGVGNTNPNASLGGVMSATSIPPGVMHNLFDPVTAVQRSTGIIDYRCFYVTNAHAEETLEEAKAYFSIQAVTPGTLVEIGVDPAGVGNGSVSGVAPAIPDELTPPAGVAFSAPITPGAAIAIGNLFPTGAVALWLRRTIPPGAAPAFSDGVEVAIVGKPRIKPKRITEAGDRRVTEAGDGRETQ